MKIIFTILLLLLYVIAVNAQVSPMWGVRYDSPRSQFGGYGDDIANSLAIDDSGNVYVTGYSYHNDIDSGKYSTIKYNSSGIVQWIAKYNGPVNGHNEAKAIALDGAGNVYVTGSSVGNGSGIDYATVKYNSAGVEQWAARYNGLANLNDYALSIAIDDAGNVYVAGNSNIPEYGYASDIVIVKYDPAGAEQWSTRYAAAGNSYHHLSGLAVDNIGNVFVCGRSYSGSNTDYLTIKYNSAGLIQWAATYNGPANRNDFARGIALDNAGNVYITGTSFGNDGGSQYATIKYNSVGVEQWVERYNGPVSGTNSASCIVVDEASNVYVTGTSYIGINTFPFYVYDYDYATVKYNSSGTQLWAARYDGPGHGYDGATSITVDAGGNVYVTGESMRIITDPANIIFHDYATIKYDSLGFQLWEARYNGPENSFDSPTAIALDAEGNVIVTGVSSQSNAHHYPRDYATVKYYQGYYLAVSSPLAGKLWIAGGKNTIRWTGGKPGQLLALDYSTDKGQTFLDIAFAVPAETGYYEWEVPFGLLTTKAKIKITDIADTNVYALSDTFKIKGYVLTRINDLGNYENYDEIDIYSFGNTSNSLWPQSWWQQFNYSGTDPFTGFNYLDGGEVTSNLFFGSKRSDFPDWVSWVRAYGQNVCYYRKTFPPIYSPSAVLKWRFRAKDWGGSCFGMSTSSALLFKHKPQFYGRYPTFPNSIPFFILSDDIVKTVINELFTHQFGKEHWDYYGSMLELKTPNETLNDIKKMLIDDNQPLRTLTIVSNDPNDIGAHSIFAYKVEQDVQFPNLYNVFVYDNAYPSTFGNSVIVVDTAANNGNGAWFPTYAWQNWGGEKNFLLMDPVENYLTNPSLPEKKTNSTLLSENSELQIFNTADASITITDDNGNSSGYVNGVLVNDIPNTKPQIVINGSSGPPIGYSLPNGSYSVKMENYNEEPIAGFFTGNKAFMFSRSTYQSNQTDNLFFDGSVSYTNPDTVSKQISIMSVFGEVSGGNKSTLDQITAEKAYAVSNLLVAPNDSIVLDYSYDEKLVLKNFGGAKNYVLSVELASEFSSGSFRNENISLPPNSSHTVVPDWNDMYNSPLQILVDEGNDGVFDDTLHVDNLLGDPVPVELLTFTAVNTSSGVKLNWQTSTETNNYGFEVERKSLTQNNTESWNKLGFVPGAGNSNSPKLYSFTDKTAKEGKYQYRLKQIDADGKYQFSKVIEIDVKNIPLVFALAQNYPNPFNPSTTISWQSPVNSHQTLKVYDVLGNEVATLVNEFREAGRYEIMFDATKYNLSSGVYFYQLKADGFNAVKKFILAK